MVVQEIQDALGMELEEMDTQLEWSNTLVSMWKDDIVWLGQLFFTTAFKIPF